jgi:nucleosome binding factor SPN SPT16 subunit
MSVTIDAANFCTRLKQLYKHWQDGDAGLWDGASSICVAAGPASEDFRYLKSVALHIWLFGYELPGHPDLHLNPPRLAPLPNVYPQPFILLTLSTSNCRP